MNNRRREPKLARKIDKADEKQKASAKKESKKGKVTDKNYQGLRPIGEDLSSQYEEAENDLEKVAKGPN
jgi:hypothetical protein